MEVYNFQMERLLTRVYRKGVTPSCQEQIWEKKTLDGNPFWGIGDFGGISVDGIIKYGKELTELEWQGNELFFSEDCLETLETKVIAVYLALKKQMEEFFSGRLFDLVVSVDMENCTGTIRFYAIRDGYHYIEPVRENVSGFQHEAILIETVNDAHLEAYIPLLVERLKNVPANIQYTQDKEIEIQNPLSEEHIYISWDDEFTVYFGSFHGHYGEEEWEELMETVEKLISGVWVAGRIESSGRWMGSFLLEAEEIPVTSKSRLLKYLFGSRKDSYKEVQRNGGIFSITAWNPEKSRTYIITKKEDARRGVIAEQMGNGQL